MTVDDADLVRAVVVVAFGACGVRLVRLQTTRRLGFIVLLAGAAAALWTVTSALRRTGDASLVAAGAVALSGALALGAGLHLLAALPDGRLRSGLRRVVVGAGYALMVVAAALRVAQRPNPSPWTLLGPVLAVVATGLFLAGATYRRSRGVDRRRLQWVGVAVVVWIEISLLTAVLHVMLGWPPRPGVIMTAGLVVIPIALVAAVSPDVVGRVDGVLSHTVSLAGLTAVIATIYLVIVVGLGRAPTDDERTILVLSMSAAAASALVFAPTRAWVERTANHLVYGESTDPGDALDTFGARLTRTLPMDELLLQLAELAGKHLELRSSEVWTGSGGCLCVCQGASVMASRCRSSASMRRQT